MVYTSLKAEHAVFISAYTDPELLPDTPVVEPRASNHDTPDKTLGRAKGYALTAAVLGSTVLSQSVGGDIDPTGRLVWLNQFVTEYVKPIGVAFVLCAALAVKNVIKHIITPDPTPN